MSAMRLSEKLRRRAMGYLEALAAATQASSVDRAGLFARAAEAQFCAEEAERDELRERRHSVPTSAGNSRPRRGVDLRRAH